MTLTELLQDVLLAGAQLAEGLGRILHEVLQLDGLCLAANGKDVRRHGSLHLRLLEVDDLAVILEEVDLWGRRVGGVDGQRQDAD